MFSPHAQLKSSLSVLALAASGIFVSAQAFALTPTPDMTIVYSYNYESDSGYADINECVRTAWNAKGVQVAQEIVHDFVSNPGEKNVYCANVPRGGSSNRYLVHLDNEGDFRCQEILSGIFPLIKFRGASDFFCGI